MLKPSHELPDLGIPSYATALLKALHFTAPDPSHLSDLNPAQWDFLLTLCDRLQLTLLLGHLGTGYLPAKVADRIAKNSRDNALRFARLQTDIAEIGRALSHHGIPVVLLKGTSHAPHFTQDPLLRAQGDIDLWCQSDQVNVVSRILEALGYRPIGKSKGRHLDPMIRERSWTWTGDYFAPDLPIPVDLHYQLWDSKNEFLAGPDERSVWDRCVSVPVDFGSYTRQLSLPDRLLFAALHFLMHFLHGDVRLQRAWEIGFFLHHFRRDTQFWKCWKHLYSDELLHLQTVAFLLIAKWFGCALPDQVELQKERLSPAVRLWIRDYGWSPIQSLFHPNKDELWLNLALLHSSRAKLIVLLRRLLPLHAAQLPSRSAPSTTLARSRHHLSAFPRTCCNGLLFWYRAISQA